MVWAQTNSDEQSGSGTANAAPRGMETLTHADDGLQARARKNDAVTQVKKGMHRLEQGMARFMDHNGRTVNTLAWSGAVLLVAGLALRPSVRARVAPRLALGWSSIRKPLRKRSWAERMRSRMNPVASVGALACAGGLIGTGVMMILKPKWFTGRA